MEVHSEKPAAEKSGVIKISENQPFFAKKYHHDIIPLPSVIRYWVARLVSYYVSRLRFSLPIADLRIPIRATQPQPFDMDRK